jgi:hypothetical protein
MEWGFIWLMLVLKIPLVGLFWIVWWAIHAVNEPGDAHDEQGGQGELPKAPSPRPQAPPRTRGPHGEPAPSAPPRIRVPGVRAPVQRD